jgi:hypothetical protein
MLLLVLSAVFAAAQSDNGAASNSPPKVAIVVPSEGATVAAPANITIVANASDTDGYLTIQTVEFFAGTTSLGVRTNFPTLNPIGPFVLSWERVPAGDYTLTAIARDDHGAKGTSAPVHIVVRSAEPEQTVVSVVAVFPQTSEPNPLADIVPGQFALRRTGNLNVAIPVSFRLGGTAVNGQDYSFISNRVVIPAGSTQAIINVFANSDAFVEGTETVVLTLESPVCIAIFPAPPECYTVGSPGEATVSIADSPEMITTVNVVATQPQTSEPNPLALIVPGQFAIRRTGNLDVAIPVFFTLSGTASNGVDYAFVSNSVVIPPGATQAFVRVLALTDGLAEGTETVVLTIEPVGCIAIFPPPPGCYAIGLSRQATVFIADFPNTTNRAPTVSIVTPTNGATINAGANIILGANASAPNGLRRVDFFDGESFLGTATGPVPGAVGGWVLVWTNALAGEHTMTAVVTDLTELRGTSAPVHIKVQSSNTTERTIVSVIATDSQASEAGVLAVVDAGQFAIRRTGNLNVAIPVSFTLSGTASNGVDYFFISNRVVIPAGSTQALVNVSARIDNQIEGIETLVLTLESPICIAIAPPPPECYFVGERNQATVFISDGLFGTNPPLTVLILQPTNNAVFKAGANVDLRASVQFQSSDQARVEFFEGTNRIGVAVFVPTLCPSPYCPFWALTWSNVPPGTYTITARTTGLGAVGVSAPVTIRVEGDLPAVSIVTPTNGATFSAGANILLGANTSSSSNAIAKVEFFAGERSLGFADGPLRTPYGSWLLTWSNVLAGEYSIVAKATDSLGATALSAPVRIRVGASTDIRPVVKIISPSNGDVFPGPLNIPIQIETVVSNGSVTAVDVYAGTNRLGSASSIFDDPIGPKSVQGPGIPDGWVFVWTNVQVGTYALTARATDNLRVSSVSAPVQITVLGASTNLPLVTVLATTPNATEEPIFVIPTATRDGVMIITNLPPIVPTPVNVGRFSIRREGGPTNFPLTVYYSLSGTASNGVDYVRLPESITIPAGASAAYVVVIPIDDLLVEENETVVLTLRPGIIGAQLGYRLGASNVATVVIHDNDFANHPPTVTILSPPNGATFRTNTSIHIEAVTRDPDGYANTVEFFANEKKIGEASIIFIRVPSPGEPIYVDFTWTNPPAGEYRLTALTHDNNEAHGISAPVQIRVGEPSVRITAPAQTFEAIRTLGYRLLVGEGEGVFVIECSTNLQDWLPIRTNQVFGAQIEIIDAEAGNSPARFYRARMVP